MKKLKFRISVLLLTFLISVGICIGISGCGSQNAPSRNEAAYQNALYIYMCGSTLETNGGAATKNLSEMLEAEVPEGTAIVVET